MLAPFISPGLPPETLVISFAVLLILGLTAAVDAQKGEVPDLPIIFGILAAFLVQGVYGNWLLAAENLLAGAGVAALIWATNEIYFRMRGRDALGMGDAKWTMLAVTGFGIMPAAMAWGLGACLALAWMAVRRLVLPACNDGVVYFAPFLFVGLTIGIYIFN